MSEDKVNQAFAYRFHVDGRISKEQLPNEMKTVDDVLTGEFGYVTEIGDGFWLVLHGDNDLSKTHAESKLPLNKALNKIYSASSYKGDLLLVKATHVLDEWNISSVDLLMGDWDISPLSEYITEPSIHNDHHIRWKKDQL